MSRKRSKEETIEILREYHVEGKSFAEIGEKHGRLGSKGGKGLVSTASDTGKVILENSEKSIQASEFFRNVEKRRELAFEKLQVGLKHENPHIMMDAVKTTLKNTGDLADNVNIKGDFRTIFAEFIVDPKE